MNQGWHHDGEKPSPRPVSEADTGEAKRGSTARKTLPWLCLLLTAWFTACGTTSGASRQEDETGHASLVWLSADKKAPPRTEQSKAQEQKTPERRSHVYFTPRSKPKKADTKGISKQQPKSRASHQLTQSVRNEPENRQGKQSVGRRGVPTEPRRLRAHEIPTVAMPPIRPRTARPQSTGNVKLGRWQTTVTPNAPRQVPRSILRDNPFRELLKPARPNSPSVQTTDGSTVRHTSSAGTPNILQASGTRPASPERTGTRPVRYIAPPPRDPDMQLQVDLSPSPPIADNSAAPSIGHQTAPDPHAPNRQTPYISGPRRTAAHSPSPQPSSMPSTPVPDPQPKPKKSPLAGLRLPHLPELPSGMGVPRPDTQTREKYSKFVIEENDPDNTLTLVVGRPKVLRFREAPLRTYLPEAGSQVIAMRYVEPESGTHVAIEPLKTGSTVMSMWFRDEDAPGGQRYLSWLVNVVDDPERGRRLEAIYASLENEINRNFPDSVVRLSLVGEKLLVRGQAKDIEDATQILRVIGANAPGGAENVALRNVDMNLISQLNPDGGNAFDDGALQSLMLRTAEKDAIEAGSTVINMLRVAGEQQVMLKVIVAEVNRNALRAIGARMTAGSTNLMSAFAKSGAGSSINSSILAAEGGTFGINHGDFQLTLNALRRLGYAKTLAEPNVVSLNGQAAVFRAGDTFPVPAANVGSNGAVGQSVAQQFVGVQIRFLPVVTDKDRVRLQLAGTVSALDNSLGARVGGSNVPGTSTRNFFTTVEMREGQTLALAGLISTSSQAESSRTPFAGDVPVIGRLFNTDSVAAQEQELLILVTPQLVHPLDPEETLPLPGSNLFEPGDLEFYFHGRLEGTGRSFRSAVHTSWERYRAQRRAEQQLIIGPTGYSDWQ